MSGNCITGESADDVPNRSTRICPSCITALQRTKFIQYARQICLYHRSKISADEERSVLVEKFELKRQKMKRPYRRSRSIATIVTTLLTFAALHSAQSQTSSVVKIKSLMIDTQVRPGIGQFVSADDDVQHLVYELFMVNWQKEDLR